LTRNYKHTIMASLKKVFFTLVFAAFSITQSFAGYIADSDLSNSAGSNEGQNQTGMYIFIVLLLVLSVVVAYAKKKEA
jgi:ABC-type branched-subunit amino acid transport system permease subunit